MVCFCSVLHLILVVTLGVNSNDISVFLSAMFGHANPGCTAIFS